DAKQQEVSVGGGYTIGGTPNINISASKDKIHSNYDSVKEQTGIFAGKGGFDVNVKEHTQLDGAVIASTADKDKNRLDTGTLGWKDIDNKADFTAEHTGGSMGTGGPIGGQLLTNAAGGLLSNANNSGHAEGTTQSAVSEGTVIVRNEDKQKQDVNELNRDTEHANNGSINPIFDKEKEQNRLKQSQLIGEIGNQAMDIIRTEGDIAGLKAQKDPDALAIAKKQLETAGKTPTEQAIKDQAYNNAMAQYGTGSDFQKAAQAVTGLLQGLAGDNLAGALANASSPYLATKIKELTTDPATGEVNKATNAMAHAVLGAVVAELNNQSAVAGGLGAGGGELSAHVILNTLFSGKKVSDLTESEKQQVSTLSQLAAGLAGGLTTGDMAGAITGSQAGKNAVENNALSDLVEAQAAGKTPQKVAEERINAEIEHYKKENCAGMSTGACSAKMAEDRDKFFREAASLGIDFVPVVGDFKSFAEADGWIDYTLAAAGTLPFAKIFTKPLKEAKLLLKAGDLDGANKLIKEASDGIPTKLPSNPTSQSSSGAWKPSDSKIMQASIKFQMDLLMR
ncbi:VENN motif pre-toxin domain-containing protein, partial [Proteus mirabilis]|uniref:VENN motif pre-toxin domain-containing protein n=1 Tax=Proteus mirabilis TaxID=584 RepID=UPI0023F8E9A2